MSLRTKRKERNKRNKKKEIIITRLLPLNRKGRRAVARYMMERDGRKRINKPGMLDKVKTSFFAVNWELVWEHYVIDHEKYVERMEAKKQKAAK